MTITDRITDIALDQFSRDQIALIADEIDFLTVEIIALGQEIHEAVDSGDLGVCDLIEDRDACLARREQLEESAETIRQTILARI
jgi:hypothetical protein